jgi:hypothetical protein
MLDARITLMSLRPPTFLCRSGALPLRDHRFDILDLDELGSLVENAICRANASRGWCIDHVGFDRPEAWGLKYFASATHRRELDAWQCPARQFLTRAAADNDPRLVVYRAPAHVCNGCALKPDCTHSDDGREIVAFPDAWLQSQLGRFHRGLSLSLCVLAGLLVAVEFFRGRTSPERVLLAGLLVLITAFAKRLAAELPSNGIFG